MASKKGLSDVVSNVLIILIVVAAVAILGLIVVNMVRNTDVSTASFTCTQLQIEPTVCNYNAANLATYVIQRKDSLSDVTVKSVTYSLSRATPADSESITTVTGLIPIQTLSSTSAKSSVPTTLEVVSAIILDENEEDYVCAINKKLDCSPLAVTSYSLTVNNGDPPYTRILGNGISCTGDCSEIYPSGTSVTLTASRLTATGGSGTSPAILMNGNKVVSLTKLASSGAPGVYTIQWSIT